MLTEKERARNVANLLEAVRQIAEAVPGSAEELSALALASVALAAMTRSDRWRRRCDA
jgi:hypothetical protein